MPENLPIFLPTGVSSAIVVGNFSSSTAIYDFPTPANDIAGDNGVVCVHGTGLVNTKIFGLKTLILSEQVDQNTLGLVIENRNAPNAGCAFRLNDNGTFDIFNRPNAGNGVPQISLGTSGDTGNIFLKQDTGTSQGTLTLGAATGSLQFFSDTSPHLGGAVKQTVTGANGGNAAVASLLSALAGYGLIVNSSTASNTPPVLYSISGASPAAGDNHIASGSATLNGTTGVVVTLTGSAVFADTNYVVQVTRTQATAHPGAGIYVTITDGADFTIFSDNSADTGTTVVWTAIGY